jgi:hypothetical protein
VATDSADIAQPSRGELIEARTDDEEHGAARESVDPSNISDSLLPWDRKSGATLLPVYTQNGSGRLRIIKASDLRFLPPPEWLIDGVLLVETLALFWGPGNSCKTFLALDFALSVANGVPWQGRATKGGNVLYMVGESLTGFNGRIDAWLRANGGSNDGLYVFPEMPQFLEAAQTAEVIALARSVGDFRLVIIDTLARAFVGGDEDKAKDMGVFIENIERLRKEDQGDDPRGSPHDQEGRRSARFECASVGHAHRVKHEPQGCFAHAALSAPEGRPRIRSD